MRKKKKKLIRKERGNYRKFRKDLRKLYFTQIRFKSISPNPKY